MREIMYRGIPKDDSVRHFFADIWKDNCEGSFVYGSLIISKDKYYICVSALCALNCCINNGMTSMIEVIPETVGQYTGLEANGKKIFEGDIVKVYARGYHTICTVSWAEIVAQFQLWQVNTVPKTPTNLNLGNYDCEVIGNIYDNPELLKGAMQNER